MIVPSCDLCGAPARSFCSTGCQNEVERETYLMGSPFARRSLVYAFDYDGTWSADPDGSRLMVELLRGRGHTCILVTGRSESGPYGADVKQAIGDLMPVIFAAGGWKDSAAKRAGYTVDVWIDDQPQGIREIHPDALAFKREQERKAR